MAINLGSLLWKGEGFLEGQRPNHSLILQVNVWGRAWRHWRGQKDAHPAPSCSVPFSQAKGVTSHQGSPSLPRAQSSCNCRCDAQVENSQNSTVSCRGHRKPWGSLKAFFQGHRLTIWPRAFCVTVSEQVRFPWPGRAIEGVSNTPLSTQSSVFLIHIPFLYSWNCWTSLTSLNTSWKWIFLYCRRQYM